MAQSTFCYFASGGLFFIFLYLFSLARSLACSKYIYIFFLYALAISCHLLILFSFLQVDSPLIRKTAIIKIFKNSLELPLSSSSVLAWLATDFLILVDDLQYFTMDCLYDADLMPCEQPTEQMLIPPRIAGQPRLVNAALVTVDVFPGIMLPEFYAQLFSSIQDETTRIPLLRSYVNTLFSKKVKSVAAVLWMMKLFAIPTIHALIPRCLSPDEVTIVGTALKSGFNGISDKLQMYAAAFTLPLLLHACDLRIALSKELSLEGLLCLIRSVKLIGISYAPYTALKNTVHSGLEVFYTFIYQYLLIC